MKVVWKSIGGYEDSYKVSNYGLIFSFKSNRLLKQSGNRYKKVCLYKNGDHKHYSVHRLVAIEFIKNEHNKRCVNHKNGNKLDNRAENLEWCTYSENTNHALESGLISDEKNHGYRNGRSVASLSSVLTIREVYKHMPGTLVEKYDDLAEIFSLSRMTIFNIIKQNTWKKEFL